MDRTSLASHYITTCCPHPGAFSGTSEVHQYLKQTATEMRESEPSDVFPERCIEHVAFALDMVASNDFLSPPAAIASVYLATRFEFYFRILSGKLCADGKWLSPESQKQAQTAIKDCRLAKKSISSVALAYKLMKLDQTRKIAQVFKRLDDNLYATPTKAFGGKPVADIGDRIEAGRNAVGHGHWGDISSESLFYGLVTALAFYNQT